MKIEELNGKTLDEVLSITRQEQALAFDQLNHEVSVYEGLFKHVEDIYQLASLKAFLWQIKARNEPLFFSQFGQDKFIYEELFEGRCDGFYLEVGGYNGYTGSNCLFFEIIGWDGIIVEASPTLFPEIAKTRKATMVNAAISDVNGQGKYVDITHGYTQMGGLIDSTPENRLDLVRRNPLHSENIISVPTLTIDELCKNHGISVVDYCSIDIEGGELAALQGINFERVDINIISIENSLRKPNTVPRKFLESKGYELITVIGPDEIYRKHS